VVGEELGRGFGIQEKREGGDVGVGVDVAEDAGGGIGLGFSDCGVEGEGMAVDVGGAEFVEINEDEMSDGGAGEGIGGGGAARRRRPRDDDAGGGETGDGLGTEEEFEAGEGRRHGRETSMAVLGREEERISFGFWRSENQAVSFPRWRFEADHSPT
jgi:hypothetical protein